MSTTTEVKPRTARARMKPLDQIPPEFICCDVIREFVTRQQGIEILVDPSDTEPRPEDKISCWGCGAPCPAGTNIRIVDPREARGETQIRNYRPTMAMIEVIDIDEAPCGDGEQGCSPVTK